MVLFFSSSVVSPPAVIYMGIDKYENDTLIQHGHTNLVWWHAENVIQSSLISTS